MYSGSHNWKAESWTGPVYQGLCSWPHGCPDSWGSWGLDSFHIPLSDCFPWIHANICVPLKMQLSPACQMWSGQHPEPPTVPHPQGEGRGGSVSAFGEDTHRQTSRRAVEDKNLICSPCKWLPSPGSQKPASAYSLHLSKHSRQQLLHRQRTHRLLVSTELSRHSLARCEEWIFSHSCPGLPGTHRETAEAGSCPVWCIWVIQNYSFYFPQLLLTCADEMQKYDKTKQNQPNLSPLW